ncbi:RNA polymerase sigma factor SigY [Clostridium folliculivorans]|uniref:RNA polymerase sigma factor SigY n=1 Tax=Clostridium folliculivorans TaxID=2886038 RepID=A0A9W5Y038_9CLOT|nr:RNA polymerase sigma factor SigY [Clostridium folliculivorans]GKU24249.1 RNA polymerase sigma factor SigY [Clostridium folliculivorans]GKU30354.1 RNA polymerase sigma factor SigY [Clostridium folliculivorans]
MNFKNQNEENLIARAKAGDKYAFEILISNNFSILKGYVLKMTLDKDLTEDIVQDTLLSAVVHIDSFVSNAKFSTWLIKIATNKYRDYLRKNKETVTLLDTFQSSSITEEEIVKKEELEEVLKILRAMPADKRTVFILKHYYGYSYEEISSIVNCPIGTVRSRLHYAIKEIISRFNGGK